MLQRPGVAVTRRGSGSYEVVLTAKQLGGQSFVGKFMSLVGSPPVPMSQAVGRQQARQSAQVAAPALVPACSGTLTATFVSCCTAACPPARLRQAVGDSHLCS